MTLKLEPWCVPKPLEWSEEEDEIESNEFKKKPRGLKQFYIPGAQEPLSDSHVMHIDNLLDMRYCVK